MTRRTKFPGVPFPRHAPQFILPGLGLREMKQHKAKISQLLEMEKKRKAAPDDTDQGELLQSIFVVVGELTHAALLRNYPEVKAEEVEEFIDMNNLQSVMLAILGQSGFELVTRLEGSPTEGPESGE